MDTPAGIFARLAAEAAAKGLEPPTLLALLKHPLFRLGGAPGLAASARSKCWNWRCCAAPGRKPEAAGLRATSSAFRNELGKLRRAGESHRCIAAGAADAASRSPNSIGHRSLITQLQRALAPLESLASSKPYDFAELAQRHREVLARVVVRPARHCHRLRGTRGIGAGLRVRRPARQSSSRAA